MVRSTCIFHCEVLHNYTPAVSEIEGDDFVGQAFQFLTAGFETSGSTLIFALYEIALHPEIQNRLRVEIMQELNKHNGQPTYDGIQDLAYLDKVVSGRSIETGYNIIRTFNGKLGPSIC